MEGGREESSSSPSLVRYIHFALLLLKKILIYLFSPSYGLNSREGMSFEPWLVVSLRE